MKTLRKLLIIASAFLLALTGCEAKIDEAKAMERTKGYDAQKVAETYKSVDIKCTSIVNKNTGAFAEGGIFYEELVLPMKGMLNISAEEQEADHYIYTGEMVESLMASVSNSKNKADVTYYAYKNTGLKISAVSNYEEENEGMKVKGGSKIEMFFLDDGRIEKATGSSKMDTSGKYEEKDAKGSFNLSFIMKFTWHTA